MLRDNSSFRRITEKRQRTLKLEADRQCPHRAEQIRLQPIGCTGTFVHGQIKAGNSHTHCRVAPPPQALHLTELHNLYPLGPHSHYL